MEKYTIGEIESTKMNQFEVIIIGDVNDADYVTTREFYPEIFFDDYVIDELIELMGEYLYSPQNFSSHNISIPYGEDGRCHTIEKVEVNYYDNNGSVRPVKINTGYFSVCHDCDWDLEDCKCGDGDKE